jgi:hypothetical protein
MQALHNLDAGVTWQGGFDWYLAHQDEGDEWQVARDALVACGMHDAAELLSRAAKLHDDHIEAQEASDWTLDERNYIERMRELDQEWEQFVRPLHIALADWRAPRGLSEFTRQ